MNNWSIISLPTFSSCIASNNSDEFISPELNLTRSSRKSSYLEIISVCDGPLQMTADATDSMSDSESESVSDSKGKPSSVVRSLRQWDRRPFHLMRKL
jgi:hypothetical protein